MRLRTRLSLLWTLTFALAASAMTLVSAGRQARALRAALERRGETLARALAARGERLMAEAGPRPIRPEDLSARLAPLRDGLWHEDGLMAAEVVSLSGETLLSERLGAEPDPYRVSYPLRSGAEAIALVRLELSRERVTQETAAAWRNALLAALALALAGAGFATLVARAITRPIDRLAQSAARLAAGEHGAAVDAAGPEEVAALARAFNTMSAAVAEREARLAEQNAALVRLGEAREALTHMIVHDLKGPLSSIRGGLDAVRDGVTEADREIVELMGDRADRALRLVADLLDVHRLQHGRLALTPTHLDVALLCREAAALCALEARERGIDLRVAAPPDHRASADRELLTRVLVNLITNALRHAHGTREVVIEAASDGEGGVRVEVTDHGPGVPAAGRERIFEMFAQVEVPGAARRGTGLGLAFCRLAIQAHGGTIWVESGEQGGSRFCFTLPRPPGAASEANGAAS